MHADTTSLSCSLPSCLVLRSDTHLGSLSIQKRSSIDLVCDPSIERKSRRYARRLVLSHWFWLYGTVKGWIYFSPLLHLQVVRTQVKCSVPTLRRTARVLRTNSLCVPVGAHIPAALVHVSKVLPRKHIEKCLLYLQEKGNTKMASFLSHIQGALSHFIWPMYA